jgi:dimethylhistidine N-methyltransferase
MRPFVASGASPASLERKAFADDVAYYLRLDPKQLPSRYFYDPLGSALFEAICHLPWYWITRAEQGLLTAHASEILERFPSLSTIVELGPGSGEKVSLLVRAARSTASLTVHLVDVSAVALDLATRTLNAYDLKVERHQASYEAGLEALSRRHDRRTLVLFLGSNVGNFDPPGAAEFLRTIRRALRPDDALLIGADLLKPERDLLLAYDDPLGVTAAFNRNLLVRVNRELDADFDIDALSTARFGTRSNRASKHLVSTRTQRVRIANSRLDLTLGDGRRSGPSSEMPSRGDRRDARARQVPGDPAVGRCAQRLRADAGGGRVTPARLKRIGDETCTRERDGARSRSTMMNSSRLSDHIPVDKRVRAA